MGERKEEVSITNFDVLDNINKHRDSSIPLFLTAFRDNRSRMGTTVNTSALYSEKAKLWFVHQQFTEVYRKFIEVYHRYCNSPSDNTDPVLKKFLSKLKELADLEFNQQVWRYACFDTIYKQTLYLLNDLIGDNSLRALTPEETENYIRTAKDILASVSKPLSETEAQEALQPVGTYGNTTINVIDVCHDRDICCKFILDNNPPKDWKEQYQDNKVVQVIGEAYERGRPTSEYIACARAARELMLWIHGVGCEYTVFTPPADIQYIDPHEIGDYELSVSMELANGEHEVYFTFNDIGYPRNSEGEYTIVAAALNVLLALDKGFYQKTLEKGHYPGCNPLELICNQ